MDETAELLSLASAFFLTNLRPDDPMSSAPHYWWKGDIGGGAFTLCFAFDFHRQPTVFTLKQGNKSLAHIYLTSDEWTGDIGPRARPVLAPGFYRLGMSSPWLWEQLRGVLTEEARFELRASLPFDAWPRAFPSEELFR